MIEKDEEKYLNQLFEEARNMPLAVSKADVKRLINSIDKQASRETNILSLIPIINFCSQYKRIVTVAAGIVLIIGLGFFYHRLTANRIPLDKFSEEHANKHGDEDLMFTLLDSGRVNDLSHFDSAKTSFLTKDNEYQNILCFDANTYTSSCEINIDLCVRKPEEMNLLLANVKGDSIMHLLSSITQRVQDSSYKFDLCMLSAGDYQVVLETCGGQRYSQRITLN